MQTNERDWRAFSQNVAIRAILWLALRLPYERRVPFVGWIVSRVIAPLARWDRRIRINLAHTCPDLPAEEVNRLVRAVPDNAGRALIEMYSGREFTERAGASPLDGPGVEPFREARAAGRPVIFVTAHFGNYEASRAAVSAQGHEIGVLYRPMRNAAFNEHYVEAMKTLGEPAFAADRKGILNLVRYLSKGGILGILVDVFAHGGAPLTFFGKPAPTALSAAEWALRYDALVVPIYAIRQADGLTFRVFLDTPIAHTTPEVMTQALNDSLEAQVRERMDQWFWIHRRWSKSPPEGTA